jgi:hypothetical protein
MNRWLLVAMVVAILWLGRKVGLFVPELDV